jgi:hypothetical protein
MRLSPKLGRAKPGIIQRFAQCMMHKKYCINVSAATQVKSGHMAHWKKNTNMAESLTHDIIPKHCRRHARHSKL